MSELEEIWSKLSLTEREQMKVPIEVEWVEEAMARGHYCLVGKVLTKKLVNVEIMKMVLFKVWRLSKELRIKKIGDKTLVFQFEEALEKEKVLLKQPWSFNKSLVVLGSLMEKRDQTQSCALFGYRNDIDTGSLVLRVKDLLYGKELPSKAEVKSMIEANMSEYCGSLSLPIMAISTTNEKGPINVYMKHDESCINFGQSLENTKKVGVVMQRKEETMHENKGCVCKQGRPHKRVPRVRGFMG
ncbi:hypothetical protein REPUB_Repub19eG0087700 [Reevesia pubescens]